MRSYAPKEVELASLSRIRAPQPGPAVPPLDPRSPHRPLAAALQPFLRALHLFLGQALVPMATTYHFLGLTRGWLPEVELGEVQPLLLLPSQQRLLQQQRETPPRLHPRPLPEVAQPQAFRPDPPLGMFPLPPVLVHGVCLTGFSSPTQTVFSGPLIGSPPTYPVLDLPCLERKLRQMTRRADFPRWPRTFPITRMSRHPFTNGRKFARDMRKRQRRPMERAATPMSRNGFFTERDKPRC